MAADRCDRRPGVSFIYLYLPRGARTLLRREYAVGSPLPPGTIPSKSPNHPRAGIAPLFRWAGRPGRRRLQGTAEPASGVQLVLARSAGFSPYRFGTSKYGLKPALRTK